MGFHNIFDSLFLTLFSSDVESSKHKTIKAAKNNSNTPYIMHLAGDTGVEIDKSSVLKFIASVLTGTGIDYYDFEILHRTKEQGGSNK